MKENFGAILLGLLVFISIAIFTIISKGVGLYNQEVTLRNQIVAQQKVNQTVFDNMWKTIKQTTNVSDKYKKDFVDVLTAYTEGRNGDNKQLLMKWGNEAVPQFDSSMYKQINNVISANRADFMESQEVLIDLNRTHDNLLDTFPNNIYFKVMGIKKIDITVVTSSKTEETFKTGKEDNVDL